jgi:DNA-binding IclR family transcriptional regulator
VDRALRILLCFTSRDPVITLTRLSEMTGLYKSTVLRLTATLEERGFLVRQPDKAYALGSALIQLSAVYQRSLNLENYVRPILRQVAGDTRQTAIFYQRVGDRRRCLFKHESPRQLRVVIGEGEERPLTYGASGHILSWCEPGSADMTAVYERLPEIPVFALGEGDPDIASAGVPVLMNKSGTTQLVGALCIVGLHSHYNEETMPAMRKSLLAAGYALSEALGMSGELAGWPQT